MKKIITIAAAVCLLANLGWSQKAGEAAGEPKEEAKAVQTQDRTGLDELMTDMPEAAKQQIKEALKKAEMAKKQLGEAAGDGNKPEDVEAAMTQTREQAKKALQGAIDAIDEISGEEKAKLEKVMEQVQDRLQEKKSELEEAVQEKAQKQDGSGKTEE